MENENDYESPQLKALVKVLARKSRQLSSIDEHGTTAVYWNDSYTPLALHIAIYSINNLKRYSVNQVYKPSDIGGPHDHETDLAFDIVTPTACRKSDAEVLNNFSKVFQDCQLPVILKVNHHLLLKALFLFFGVPEDEQSNACDELRQKLENIEKKMDHLIEVQWSFTCQSQTREELLSLLSAWGNLNDVKSHLKNLPGWEGEVASLADKAFDELEEIIGQAKLSCPVFLCLNTGLELYNSHSGFIFDFICQHEKM